MTFGRTPFFSEPYNQKLPGEQSSHAGDCADQMPILATLGNYANHCRFTGIIIMITAITGNSDINTSKNTYFAGD
ncbi:hypothetical protein [Desulfosediminicola ganghwensis]|uniref:hypothetical protein n=1 Tax=Desulfosediminicola ganghwensis TaxID=2569540 RepID=UPI0010ACE834|nr:hypothetical protein [Desulfosediminicola ganghwensis]